MQIPCRILRNCILARTRRHAIETEPDLRGFAAANALDGKRDGEVRAVMGDKFHKRKRVV